MNSFQTMRSAFDDELAKIAGELQGHIRIGRRPISVERLLEREAEESQPVEAAPKVEEKTSGVKIPISAKNLALLGAGGLTVMQAQRMKRRYDMGKQMELQSTGGYGTF